LVENDQNLSLKSQNVLNLLRKEKNLNREEIDPELENYFRYLSLKSEVEEIDQKDAFSEIQTCLKELHFLKIKEKLDMVSQQLREAEVRGDNELINQLINEFNQYSKELYNLQTFKEK